MLEAGDALVVPRGVMHSAEVVSDETVAARGVTNRCASGCVRIIELNS